MVWLYVPGLVVSKWESESPIPNLEQSLTWRGKPFPRRSWQNVWKKDYWIQVLFGLTSRPSILNPGVESFRSSLAVFPVNLGVLPESGKKLPTLGGYGTQSLKSFAKLDPSMSFLRTSPEWLLEDLNVFSGRWPKSGSMRSGICFERPIAEHRKSGNACSSWATPTAHDGRRPGLDMKSTQKRNLSREVGEWVNQNWPTPRAANPGSRKPGTGGKVLNEEATKNWPTPAANPYGTNQGGAAGRTGPVRPSLETLAKVWPTPTTTERSGTNPKTGRGDGLSKIAKEKWPTPTVGDSRNAANNTAGRSEDAKHHHSGNTLIDATRKWATPTSRDWKDGASPSEKVPTNSLLGRQAPRSHPKGSKPVLNPRFVEHLQGLPIGWTGSEPVEMRFYLLWQHTHGQFLKRGAHTNEQRDV